MNRMLMNLMSLLRLASDKNVCATEADVRFEKLKAFDRRIKLIVLMFALLSTVLALESCIPLTTAVV